MTDHEPKLHAPSKCVGMVDPELLAPVDVDKRPKLAAASTIAAGLAAMLRTVEAQPPQSAAPEQPL